MDLEILEVGKNILSMEAREEPIEERLYRSNDMKIKMFMYKHEKTYKQN